MCDVKDKFLTLFNLLMLNISAFRAYTSTYLNHASVIVICFHNYLFIIYMMLSELLQINDIIKSLL